MTNFINPYQTEVLLCGGSIMDCAKAIAFLSKNDGDINDYIYNRLRSDDALPLVLIPTTCGTGSEGNGFAVVSPEAAVGGPIALVEEGDIIRINIPENKLDVLVSDEELAARRAKWQPREPKITTGYLARYHELVTSGNRGAVLEAPSQKN